MKQKLSIFEVEKMKHTSHLTPHTGNGIGKFLKLCIFIWMLMKVDVGWGQNNNYFVLELGLSYDEEFVQLFGGNETNARNALVDMVKNVNYMYLLGVNDDNLHIEYKLKQLRKITGLTTNRGKYARDIATSWQYGGTGQELCFTPDIVHHVTGRPEVNLGHATTGGVCKNFINSGVQSASYSRYEFINPNISAFRMAHELLHQYAGAEEICPEPLPFDTYPLFCEGINNFGEGSPYDNIWISQDLRNRIRTNLNRSENSCALSSNEQTVQLDPNCQSCESKVIFSAPGTEFDTYFDLPCDRDWTEEDLTIDLKTIFKNSCHERVIQAEIWYNHNHVTEFSVPDNYTGPTDYNVGNYTKKLLSPQYSLAKGSEHGSLYEIKFNGTATYDINTGRYFTPVRVWYNFIINPPNLGSHYGVYLYHFPYKIDKRGIANVSALDIRTPVPSQPYNFCSGIRHDIYIDGDLTIDYDASYCNAHFIMGQNSKIIIDPNKKVLFDNCTFRTCDPSVKWTGIVAGVGADIRVTGESKFYSAITAIKCDNAAQLFVEGTNTTRTVLFNDCSTGISYRFTNPAFFNGILNVNFATFENTAIGIEMFNAGALIENSFFNNRLGFGGFAITARGAGQTLSVAKNCRFDNHLSAITTRGMRVDVNQITMQNNRIGLHITNAPNLSHSLKGVKSYDSKDWGIRLSNTSNLSTNLKSIVDNCTIRDCAGIGLGLYNTKLGWNIKGAFIDNRTGIRMSDSDDNIIYNSNFTFNGPGRSNISNMNFIHMSSSDNNYIGSDDISVNYFDIFATPQPGALYRHIFLNNAGMNNRILCNAFTNGNRGINPWGQSQTEIAGNDFNYIERGLYYGLESGDDVTSTGRQEFKNNKWTLADMNNDIGATHLGANVFIVRQSRYLTHDDTKPYTPKFEAVDDEWFTKPPVVQSPYNCSTGFTGGGGSEGGNGLFQMMTLGNGFNGFQYNTGMNAAAQDYLYDAITGGEGFGSSSGDVASYLKE